MLTLLLDDLDNVFIVHHVLHTNSLGTVLCTRTLQRGVTTVTPWQPEKKGETHPNESIFELVSNSSMDGMTLREAKNVGDQRV